MTIVYHLAADGGFTAGNTETRITAYAYPTSHYARRAKRAAAATAVKMLADEQRPPLGYEAEYDARHWRILEGRP